MIEWLPGIAKQSWGTDGGSFNGGPPKGVLHSTETTGWPSYQNGDNAPHFTLKPNLEEHTVEIRQHIPLTRAARALRNEAGGVQTNRDSAIQIELVGTTDRNYSQLPNRCILWPSAPSWALIPLRDLMRKLEVECKIAPVACAPWAPYPRSYGKNAMQRMSLSQWDNFSGWCAHQHVPENTHGDVELDIRYLMDRNAVLPVEIFSPVKVPVINKSNQVSTPKFPLYSPYYYGLKEEKFAKSGYYGAEDRRNIRLWQKQMKIRGWKIAVDGLFGPDCDIITRRFQREKKLHVDGRVGALTWRATWEAPVSP